MSLNAVKFLRVLRIKITVFLALVAVLIAATSVFSLPKNIYERYGFQIYPPLVKEREIVIVATNSSPRRIRMQWIRKDGSTLFDKEFNVESGEKVIITPIINK